MQLFHEAGSYIGDMPSKPLNLTGSGGKEHAWKVEKVDGRWWAFRVTFKKTNVAGRQDHVTGSLNGYASEPLAEAAVCDIINSGISPLA